MIFSAASLTANLFYKFPTDINREMKWWSNKSIITVILFIGILLLVIGYFYFGYNKEGFQTASGSASGTENVCLTGTNEQKCNTDCVRDPLPSPTSDEEQSYSIYESKNLVNTYESKDYIDADLTFPPVVLPTTVERFNSAGALSSFDVDPTRPIPWDFDNKDLDPANSLFGSICSEASKLIFAKCEMQELFGDINNIDYDPDAGIFKYKSQFFGFDVYDQNEAAALQFGEIFINLKTGEWMGMALDSPFDAAENYVERKYEAQNKLGNQIDDYKKALSRNGGNKDIAAQEVINNHKNGKYDTLWHDEQEKDLSKRKAGPLGELDKVPGVDDRKRGPVRFGRGALVKDPLDLDFSDPKKVIAGLDKAIEIGVDDKIKQAKMKVDNTKTPTFQTGEKFKAIFGLKSFINKNNTSKNISQGIREKNTTFSSLNFLTGKKRQNAKIVSNIAKASKLAKKLITTEAVKVAYNTFMIGINALLVAARYTGNVLLIAFLTPLVTGSNYFFGLMLLIQIACSTFVPAIFSSFLDQDAVCPLNEDGSFMFNFEDHMTGKPNANSNFPDKLGGKVAGSIIYSLIQNIDGFGDLLSGFGPYICFSNSEKDWDPINLKETGGPVKLKNNLKSPPYYYDPTLSIYNAGSKPKFQAGKSNLDQRLFNPLTFHYNKDISIPKDAADKPGYPIWVDFANPIMLNKMAQFYYDASRKCYTTTDDGMLAFQYISKFYGLISTTELTCDVQCEITEIKFDPATGAKICEVIVPIEPDNFGTMHHDRRFYFFKDMGKAVVNRINQIDQTNTAALQALMEDNLNIYTVTGCTNTDGTAPDCATYNSEGNSVSNPVISLGPPSGVYNGPFVDIGSVNNLPQESVCGKNLNFSRYNGISHPATSKSSNTNNADIKIIKNPVEDDWTYAYKYAIKKDDQQYYYPSENIKNKVANTPGVTIVDTPDTLKTAKYLNIVWNAKCKYDDIDCQINSKQGVGTIVQGTMEGLVGLGFGIGQVQQVIARRGKGGGGNTFNAAAGAIPVAGAMLQGAFGITFPGQEMSVSQQISCTYDEVTNEDGTYILNGRVMTSKPGYVMDQGPFVNWAPGYTPIIKYCNKQTIELFDCVNSYAVRRFVNMYHTQNPKEQIKKINSIIPTLNTGTKWIVNNSQAMCIYDIEVVGFDDVKFKEILNTTQLKKIGVLQKQNLADKTCTFVPDQLKYRAEELFPPQIFSKNLEEPILPSEISSVTTPLLRAEDSNTNLILKYVRDNDSQAIDAINNIRSSVVQFLGSNTGTINRLPPTIAPIKDIIETAPNPKYDCSNPDKKAQLIAKFNSAHQGIPKLKSISNAWSLRTSGGNTRYCFFKGDFEITDTKLKNGLNLTGDGPVNISRNFRIFLNKDADFALDDFPILYTHIPIPKPSQWFDVPPRTYATVPGSFPRPGCSEDPVYNDCSNSALIDILVKQYNTNKTDSKILKVWRSFTPDTETRKCDYDVEILKTIGDKTIFNRETVRFSLSPTTIGCAYNLDLVGTTANLTVSNSGTSLNLSDTVGMLKTPYTTAISYSKKTQEDTISAIRNYLGYNIGNIIKSTTTDILNRFQGIRESLYKDAVLYKCPSKTCMDDTIIKAMINRYNYDNYPVYPSNQNTVTKKTIVRVTKVGTSTPKECQVELYLRTDFFVDFLYNPLTQDTKYYMHNYVFNLIDTPTPCKFKVKPFTQIDIAENRMDISGDAFSLKCPPAPEVCPSIITKSSPASYSFATDDYNEVMIRCNITNADDSVLKTVKNIYNTTVIFTKLNVKYYNTILTITKVFNAKPNILEFKISAKRVYWDDEYNVEYYTGDTADNVEESYLKVVWPEGTSYEVETGYYWKDSRDVFVEAPVLVEGFTELLNTTKYYTAKDSTGVSIKAPILYVNGVAKCGNLTMATPTIEEIFYPDLTFTNTKIFRKNLDGSTTEVYLPYLANDGLTPVDSRQTRKYTCNPTNCS